MPSLSFNTPYSDIPSNFQDSLSAPDEINDDEINDDLDSKVDKILKPEFQSCSETPVTTDGKNVPYFFNSNPHSTGIDKKEVYEIDYSNIRIQKFENRSGFILKWDLKEKRMVSFECLVEYMWIKKRMLMLSIVHMDNNNVQIFDSEGNFLLKWGSMGTGDGQFKKPAGLDMDKHDNIYVTQSGNSRIQRFDSNGKSLSAWGSKGINNDQFLDPHSIVVS